MNQTVVDDPNGFRVTFIVADALEFGPKDQIRFQVAVTNIATSTRYVSAQQPQQFLIAVPGATTGVWSDWSCGAPPAEDIPAPEPLEPGEQIRFNGTYPGQEQCRIPAGTYLAAAQVEICPPETLEPTANGQPKCNRAKNKVVTSRSLEITIRS